MGLCKTLSTYSGQHRKQKNESKESNEMEDWNSFICNEKQRMAGLYH